jgi:AcrR family transcriptional regulator
VTNEIADLLERIGVAPAVQHRSRELRDRLIAIALEISRHRPFEDVSVTDLCRAADCSTGSFYARFPDKMTLFKAVMIMSAAQSKARLETIVRSADYDSILSKLIEAQVERFRGQITFFKAAFKVGIDDPAAWEPFRANSHDLASTYIERMREHRGRALMPEEEGRVRFAFQIMYGLLNNTVLLRPGPFDFEHPMFGPHLERAMRAAIAESGFP